MGALFISCTAINLPLFSNLRQYLICQLPDIFISREVIQKYFVFESFKFFWFLAGLEVDHCTSSLPRNQGSYLRSIADLLLQVVFKMVCLNLFCLKVSFRVFERRFGSKKFASYLLSTGLLSCFLEVAAVLLIRTCGWEAYHQGFLPPGP